MDMYKFYDKYGNGKRVKVSQIFRVNIVIITALTLKALITNAADDTLKYLLFFFFQRK